MLDVLNPGPVTLPDGRHVDFANLDVAATAPCLTVVAEAVTELLPWYGSVNRGTGAAQHRGVRAGPGHGRRPARRRSRRHREKAWSSGVRSGSAYS
jgi:hypothetical protein